MSNEHVPCVGIWNSWVYNYKAKVRSFSLDLEPGLTYANLNYNHEMLWEVSRGGLIWTFQIIHSNYSNKIPNQRAMRLVLDFVFWELLEQIIYIYIYIASCISIYLARLWVYNWNKEENKTKKILKILKAPLNFGRIPFGLGPQF